MFFIECELYSPSAAFIEAARINYLAFVFHLLGKLFVKITAFEIPHLVLTVGLTKPSHYKLFRIQNDNGLCWCLHPIINQINTP